MDDHRSNITIVHSIIATVLLVLFPLFFLPFTQEFFVTNKLYFLGFAALLLMGVSLVHLFVTKKIKLSHKPLDNAMILFLVATGLSILVVSPNKIVALLNPNFGLIAIFSLTVVYFYISRLKLFGFDTPHTHEKNAHGILYALGIPGIILSVIGIAYFFQPFKNIKLPYNLQFLQNPGFSPMGSQLDLILVLGFIFMFAVTILIQHMNESEGKEGSSMMAPAIMTLVSFVTLLITAYALFKPDTTNPSGTPAFTLPPFRLSWYAAVEILKNPLSAIFGVGVNNFGAIFTSVKDIMYNQSPLWQIQSFVLSRSAILHIMTETGLFGLVAFALILIGMIKLAFSKHHHEDNVNRVLLVYIIIVLLIFPPSLNVFFLFYVLAAKLAWEYVPVDGERKLSLNLEHLAPVKIAFAILGLIILGAGGYFLGRSYLAENYFKRSLDAIPQNNGQALYNNQRQAIILNPYIDRFRTSFAQTNLLIANNIASKKQEEITQTDRETIAQAIQAAIAESKAAVQLHPTKASNWENLAAIYKNVLNIAQGADVWTVSSYQRAILLDPQNPAYRLSLGGVYYSLGNYDDASRMFEQAVSLKTDWSNAHYNLAWASYQRGDYKRAASEMQAVLSLLNPARDQADIDRAQKDLEEFKAKIPKETSEEKPKEESQKLSLPTPPVATFSPKLQLPKDASPEAK